MRIGLAFAANAPAQNLGLAHQRYIPAGALQGEKRQAFLSRLASFEPGKLAKDWAQRYADDIAQTPGVVSFEATTLSPLALGLGGRHPFEVGLTFHHTSGLPVIPGSSLRGAMRRVAARMLGIDVGLAEHYSPDSTETELRARLGNSPELDDFLALFGSTESSGCLTVFDAMPVDWSAVVVNEQGRQRKLMPPMMVDTVTVHHADYYQGRSELPRESDGPIPVSFLAVRPGIKFRFAFRPPGPAWTDTTHQVLESILLHDGAGAKSNVGYGRFRDITRIGE